MKINKSLYVPRSFTYLGEESAALTAGRYEFSLGNGSDVDIINANYMGFPVPYNCRINAYSLAVSTIDPATTSFTIHIGYRVKRGDPFVLLHIVDVPVGGIPNGTIFANINSNITIPAGSGILVKTTSVSGASPSNCVLSGTFEEV